MARIRSIKPEFPQSESIGKLSRDARLCFIQLWTLADDSGRLRGSSRMLASLLYPYDSDAPRLIDKWLTELVNEKCIRRYEAEGQHYIEICNWLSHQKIDHPSASKFPSPPDIREDSRGLASVSETFALDQGVDQGSRIKDQGGEAEPPSAPFQPVKRARVFTPPTLLEVGEYCRANGYTVNPETFIKFYSESDPPWHDSNGKAVKNWKQKIISTWSKNNKGDRRQPVHSGATLDMREA